MNNFRHRQVAFQSPFELEKELWVPRRDRIFVPSGFKSARSSDWITREIDMAEYVRFESMYLYRALAECVPHRGQYLGQPRNMRIPLIPLNLPRWTW